jgi:hypothetical protein
MSPSQVPPSPPPTPPPQPLSMKVADPNAAPGAAAVTPAPVPVGTPVAAGGVGAPLPPKLRRDMVGHSRSRGHGEFAVSEVLLDGGEGRSITVPYVGLELSG